MAVPIIGILVAIVVGALLIWFFTMGDKPESKKKTQAPKKEASKKAEIPITPRKGESNKPATPVTPKKDESKKKELQETPDKTLKPNEAQKKLQNLLTQPGETQKDHDNWASSNGMPAGLLKLRGAGRTADVVAHDISLVIAGARACVDLKDGSAQEALCTMPEETQKAHDAWVHANGADGTIKLRGVGRTAEVVHREIELFSVGAQKAKELKQ